MKSLPIPNVPAPLPEEIDRLVALFNQGRIAEGETLARSLTIRFPDHGFGWKVLGAVLKQQGRSEEAVTAMRQAVVLQPEDYFAWSNLGITLMGLGAFAEAEKSFRTALALNEGLAEVHNNLGIILREQGRSAEAESSYRRALELNPDYSEAYYNMGNAVHAQGRLSEAEESYRQAIKLKPDFVESYNNLGINLHKQGRLSEAETCCRTALTFRPDYAEAYNNLGLTLQDRGQPVEAETCYRRALELKADYSEAFSNLLFLLNYHPDKSCEEIFEEYKNFNARFGLPFNKIWLPHRNQLEKNRRLKVGYVSPQFDLHPVCNFLEPLLAHHDKRIVEVYAYAELSRDDDATARYKTYVDHWIPTKGMTDDALSERIRRDCIDILVDLAGHTVNNRLAVFARKPAPVSLHWLDFGYTTGLTAIDYYLADSSSVPPDSEYLFSETPWRLPAPAFAYRPTQGMGMISPLPAGDRGYVTFGTLTRAVRINHRTIRVWAEIMRRLPGSHLVINSGNFKEPRMQSWLADKFVAQGIARARLEIGCNSPPWDVLRGLDIGLDCFPHNSGTTLFENLYMGIPFVTLAGRPSVGRLGASILEGIGHPEWIAATEDEYVEKAVALAADLPRLASLRAGLRVEMETGPLMDEPAFAKKVEAAYREMFARWCESESTLDMYGEQVAGDKDSGQSFDELVQQAVAHHRSGRFQEAERLYLDLLRTRPDHHLLNYHLGLLAVQSQQPAASLPYFETALDASPENGAYWLSYIEAMAQAGQLESARQILEVAKQSGLQGEEVEALAARLADPAEQLPDVHSDPAGQGRGRKTARKKSRELRRNEDPGGRQLTGEPSADQIERLVALFTQGRLAEAETLARTMTKRYPGHGFAWKILGPTLKQQGRFQEALAAMQQAVVLLPHDSGAYYNLGIAFQDQHKYVEAEASYRRALALNPEYAEAHNNLGNTLKALGRLAEAENNLRCALKCKPNFVEAYNNLGNILKEQGQIPAAEASYRQALNLKGDYVEAYSNLGNVLKDQGRLGDAEKCYRQALKLKPDYAEVHYNLGNTLRIQKRLAESEVCFLQAIKLNPDFAEAHNNLGVSYKEQGLFVKAEASYFRALELNPQYAEAHSNLGSIFSLQGRFFEAEKRLRYAMELKPDYAKAYSNLLFLMNYHPDKAGEEIFQLYRDFDARFGLPFRKEWRPHTNSRESHRRLKVGYVTPQFCQHPVQHFLEPLLAHHDKDTVEVFAYAELYKEDPVTDRYKTYVDHWVPTMVLSDAAMTERIRQDGIDILIDIAGHTGGNRLSVFARKPAPISLHWLDFGYTTGLTAIDYYLADSSLVPVGSEGLFAEIPWRLANPAYVYRPAEGMGEVSPLPAREKGHVTFGTLTRAVRINHRTIRVWAEILKRVPGARLVIDSGIFKDPVMQAGLAAKFFAHGIEGDRLEIGCHSPPWDVLRGMDIGFDCFPHNSGTTLFETLYMGVPFITLADRPSVGRLGASVLEGVGHPEWIAGTEEEYVERAVALAADLSQLALLRAGLRGEMESGPLMDEPAFARKVEAAYREMFAKWCEEKR